MEGQLILVTGPARSGKSEWAEHLAARSGKRVTYVATAQVDPADREWQLRIEQHRLRRPSGWSTLHTPFELGTPIQAAIASDCLLIDSLGTWVANFLEQDEDCWTQITGQFLTDLQQATATVILVAEETGWGVIPAYPLGRTFRDRLGKLIQAVGMIANPVYLVAGGHVLNLSVLGTPLAIALHQ